MKAGRTDHFPKNGRSSPGKGNFKPATSAATHIPEEGKRSVKAGQWTEGSSKGSPKADKAAGTNAAHSGMKKAEHGNHPHHGRGTVPTGGHHEASHREPRSHDEFHKLGSGHWK